MKHTLICSLSAIALAASASAQHTGVRKAVADPDYPPMPEGRPPALEVPNSTATSADDMKPYRDLIPPTDVGFDMVPIPGGTFTMGSPDAEADRRADEGPQHQVTIAPFWMGRCEVTWDEFHIFQYQLDLTPRKRSRGRTVPDNAWADAVTRPTPPYIDLDLGMGIEGCPAVCMTHFAARQYTKWLSLKTGRFYRLPTEAEWEYACRAGTTTSYSFGDDVSELADYAWFYDEIVDSYQRVGQKKPNPWGLYDMHGNVAEWVLDQYIAQHYTRGDVENPVAWPTTLYPRVVRGGSWDDDPEDLRSAARRFSSKRWKAQDPMIPASIWYHTDASFVGFRIVRPLVEPPREDWPRIWDANLAEIRKVEQSQRQRGS